MILKLIEILTKNSNLILIGLTSLILIKSCFKSNDDLNTALSNEDALQSGIHTDTTETGKIYSEIKAINLDVKGFQQMYNSLADEVHDLGIKTNKLTSAVKLNLTSKDSFKVIVHTDTIFEQNNSYLVQTDSYNNGILQLNRMYKQGSIYAEYTYTYSPNLSIYGSIYKVGDWRFKNIFKPRPINSKITIISNDSSMVLDSAYYINLIKH